tara:strand:+ start:171 stop:617 length:447 start_codon:yes stop_codon:yes gene_type:complete
MIDRKARNKAALAIRRYASGRITNFEFEKSFDDSEDFAICAICGEVWRFYDDFKQHKALGKHALDKNVKRYFAKLFVFLKSDEEYVYPRGDYPWEANKSRFLSLLTFGLSDERRLIRKRVWDEIGDIQYWPFKSENHLNSALKNFSFV